MVYPFLSLRLLPTSKNVKTHLRLTVMISDVSTQDPAPLPRRTPSHRAQIAMTPHMFRQLRILAAKRDTSVTALVVEAIKNTYPEISDK